jgi:hypothetical protein
MSAPIALLLIRVHENKIRTPHLASTVSGRAAGLTLPPSSGSDYFFLRNRLCVKEGLHRRLAEAAASLVRSVPIEQRSLRTPTGRLGEKFCIAFIRGSGAMSASTR